MTSFNQAVRERIDKDLRKKQFSQKDFYDLVESYNVTRKALTTQLYRMEKRKLIQIFCESDNPRGGATINTYEVVPGAKFEVSSTEELISLKKSKVLSAEEMMNCSFQNLDKVMRLWI